MNPSSIFSIRTKKEFEKKTLEIFRLQAKHNPVYKAYVAQLGIDPDQIKTISQIPFLPIEFFKTQDIKTVSNLKSQISNLFLSSGTTGTDRSKHHVADTTLYEKSFRKCFELFYGDVKQYAILAILPSYYENRNSSLLYMVKDLMARSKNKHSAFYNAKDENILPKAKERLSKKQKVIIFGVSFALLDLVPFSFEGISGLTVIETGGMKGRKDEITREELHKTLCEKFGVKKIHSEYGMTELLSQAYSKGDGIFKCPPWMKVVVRDPNDPFQITNYELGMSNEKQTATGAINIIDLANIYSCSFIATQDVGRVHKNGSFEVLGRMDNSDLRGCNLMAG